MWRQLKPKSDYFIRLYVGEDAEYKDGAYQYAFDGHIWTFENEPIYLKATDNTETVIKYTAPAYLNGQRVRLIIIHDKITKVTRIATAYVVNDSPMPSRMYLPVKKGDKLELRYWANLWPKAKNADKYKGQPTHKWIKGRKITVGDDLTLKLQEIGDELYLANFYIQEVNEDLTESEFYTQNVEIRKRK